jgi:hypothetical protein
MKIMKKNYYKIISAICLCCGLTSCADFLEIKDQREIILEDFWNEKADVENIVSGCYSALQDADTRKRMMIWGEFRSDNIMSGNNINSDGNLYNILKENITAKNTYTTWVNFYDVINRCNTVLKYAPDVAAKDPAYTEGDLKANIAEVTALRSLCYFYLIRTFRDVPFSREAFTDDDQTMDLPATPFKEVLNNIISDLESVKNDAVKRYPTTKDRYQTGRITQDAINAMLCEMYLWAEDYDNCIKYADIVIDSKKKYAEDYYKEYYRNFSQQVQVDKRLNGFPLIYHLISGTVYGDAYETIFTSETRREAAKEVIFELNYDRDPASTGGTANSAISSFYGNSQSEVGLVTGSSYIDGEMKESTAKELFEKDKEVKDARMYMNYSTNLKSIVKMACRSINVTSAATSDAAPTSISFSLFPQNSNGSHWVIYRLSDIMLLKAEALCQKMVDGTDPEDMAINTPLLNEAFYLVNAVNKRSICRPITTELQVKDTLSIDNYGSKNLMTELVKRERRRELMFEGKRWYDLVRYAMRAGKTDEVISAVSKRDDVNSQFAQNFFKKMDAIFWPYNYEELKVNHNLVQNPSFGSGENSSMEKTAK